MKSRALFLCLLICSLTFSAFSDYKEVEDYYADLFGEIPLVVSSTLTELSIQSAPSVMSVITKDMLNKRGYRYLQDALEDLLNIHFGESVLATQTINSRNAIEPTGAVKIMIDGIELNDPLWKGYHSLAEIPLDRVKQIEYIRGPGGALYGAEAMEGVINIITEPLNEEYFGLKTGVGIGSSNHNTFHASYMNGNDTVKYFIALDQMNSDQRQYGIEYDSLQGTGIEETPATYEQDLDRFQAHAKIQAGNFKATALYIDHKQDAFLANNIYIAENTPISNLERTVMDISYNIKLNDNLLITPRAYMIDSDLTIGGKVAPPNFAIPYDLNGDGMIEFWPDGIYQVGEAITDVYGAEILLNYTTDNNNLYLGFFYKDVDSYSTDYGNIHPAYSYSLSTLTYFEPPNSSLDDVTRFTRGMFFQDVYQFNDELSGLIAGRYDDFSDFDAEFTPRAALVYNKDQVTAKLLFGQAFRVPTLEQMNVNTVSYVANPDAESYTTQTTELFLQYAFTDNYKLSVNLYQTKADDILVPSLNEYGQELLLNLSDITSKGLEVENFLAFSEFARIYFAYVYNDNDDVYEESKRYLSSEQIFLSSLSCTFFTNYHINLSYKYISPIDRSDMLLADTESYSLLNLSLAYIKDNLSVKAYIYNLLNDENYLTTYYTALSDVELAGTEASVKITYEF